MMGCAYCYAHAKAVLQPAFGPIPTPPEIDAIQLNDWVQGDLVPWPTKKTPFKILLHNFKEKWGV
jgi:hypothetical protein